MKIISIDVGIKNLAFCLLEINPDSSSYIIKKWDVINLSQKTESKCVELDKMGHPCMSPIKFTKNNKCYCLKHSKKTEFQIPTADLKPTFINKQKIQGLYDIAEKYKITYTIPIKKAELISLIHEYAHKVCFDPIENTNASKIDLVTIGRNIQFRFDTILKDEMETIDKVIIENQISPIANRMKTIQGMIAQYFIMKNNDIQIDFVNASNKLKGTGEIDPSLKAVPIKTNKTSYTERKKQGIEKTLDILNKDSLLNIWTTFFKTHKKKDDLADSFLQGVWYSSTKL